MKIWYVDCEDLSCAWTEKKDAINYFKTLAEENEWTYYFPFEKSLENNDYYVDIVCTYQEDTFRVIIHPIYLDEKPYWV